jgi:hypothetical protein
MSTVNNHLAALQKFAQEIRSTSGLSDAWVTLTEAQELFAMAEADGTVTFAEGAIIGSLFEQGVTREWNSIVTLAIPELHGDLFYMDRDTTKAFNDFFVEHKLPYGTGPMGNSPAFGEGMVDPSVVTMSDPEIGEDSLVHLSNAAPMHQTPEQDKADLVEVAGKRFASAQRRERTDVTGWEVRERGDLLGQLPGRGGGLTVYELEGRLLVVQYDNALEMERVYDVGARPITPLS